MRKQQPPARHRQPVQPSAPSAHPARPRRSWRVWRRPAPPPDWEKDLTDLQQLPVDPLPTTYRRSTQVPTVDPLQIYYRRLIMLEALLPEFDPFAWLPAMGWGLFTVGGCFFHADYLHALVVAAALSVFSAMIFATPASFRTLNVAIGFTVCLFGIVLLGAVGQVGVANLGRIIAWLLPDRRGGSMASVPPDFADVVLALPTAALVALSLHCGHILFRYLGVIREIAELRDRLLDETTPI